jgi:hypothetical protein
MLGFAFDIYEATIIQLVTPLLIKEWGIAPASMNPTGLVLSTNLSIAKPLAHEDALVAGLGAASRLFITD